MKTIFGERFFHKYIENALKHVTRKIHREHFVFSQRQQMNKITKTYGYPKRKNFATQVPGHKMALVPPRQEGFCGLVVS